MHIEGNGHFKLQRVTSADRNGLFGCNCQLYGSVQTFCTFVRAVHTSRSEHTELKRS